MNLLPIARFAGLALAIGLAGGTASALAPTGLRCTTVRGNASPAVSVYWLDRDGGRVVAEPDTLFTTAGATTRGERMASVRTIESWTDDQLILRADHSSNNGETTTTIRNVIDLKTLIIRTKGERKMRGLEPFVSANEGTCERVG